MCFKLIKKIVTEDREWVLRALIGLMNIQVSAIWWVNLVFGSCEHNERLLEMIPPNLSHYSIFSQSLTSFILDFGCLLEISLPIPIIIKSWYYQLYIYTFGKINRSFLCRGIQISKFTKFSQCLIYMTWKRGSW